MVTEANKRVFRRFYEEAWNTGDLGIIDELLDTNFVNHELVDVVGSHRESYKQALTETREAFPDWETTIDDLIAEGNRVVARWHGEGTHTGEAWGIPPTGRRMSSTGITIVRVVRGRITDFWKKDDSASIWQQETEDAEQGPR